MQAAWRRPPKRALIAFKGDTKMMLAAQTWRRSRRTGRWRTGTRDAQYALQALEEVDAGNQARFTACSWSHTGSSRRTLQSEASENGGSRDPAQMIVINTLCPAAYSPA